MFLSVASRSAVCSLSLHDALPIYIGAKLAITRAALGAKEGRDRDVVARPAYASQPAVAGDGVPGGGLDRRGFLSRSEEHTSELQSRRDLVCRLLLEKKNTKFFACF